MPSEAMALPVRHTPDCRFNLLARAAESDGVGGVNFKLAIGVALHLQQSVSAFRNSVQDQGTLSIVNGNRKTES
jgi:hypothetical protein